MTAVDTNTFIETLEQLDFAHEQPCEHSMHSSNHKDEAAMFLVRYNECSRCADPSKEYFLCLSGWETMLGGVHCRKCLVTRRREERLAILRVIGTR